VQLVEVQRQKREFPVSIPCMILWNFEVSLSLWPQSVSLVSTQPQTEKGPRNILGGKGRPVLGADSCAVLVVTNIEVRMEAQHSIYITCYGEELPFTFIL